MFLLLFLFLNGYQIRQKESLLTAPLDGHDKLLHEVEGRITNEKIYFVKDSLQEVTGAIESGKAQAGEYDADRYTGYAHGDRYEFQNLYERLAYCFFYESDMASLLEKAEKSETQYQDVGNQNGVKECQLIRALYEGRSLPSYYEMDQVERYLEYDFSEIFVLLLMILVIPVMVSGDSAVGMPEVIGTAERTMAAYLLGKAGAMAAWIAGITVLFGFQDFWMWGMLQQLGKLSQPLYSIESCRQCMMDMSVGGFLIFFYISKVLAFFCIGLGILLAALWIRKQLYTAVIAILIVGGLAVLELYNLSPWNPMGLLALYEQQKEFHTQVLMGTVIPSYVGNLICCGAECIMFITVIAGSARRIIKI